MSAVSVWGAAIILGIFGGAMNGLMAAGLAMCFYTSFFNGPVLVGYIGIALWVAGYTYDDC